MNSVETREPQPSEDTILPLNTTRISIKEAGQKLLSLTLHKGVIESYKVFDSDKSLSVTETTHGAVVSRGDQGLLTVNKVADRILVTSLASLSIEAEGAPTHFQAVINGIREINKRVRLTLVIGVICHSLNDVLVPGHRSESAAAFLSSRLER